MNELSIVIDDPARDAVLTLLASYGGLSVAVSLLVSGLKSLWKQWINGKEPVLSVILTVLLGMIAKFLVPAVYGSNSVSSWALHMVILAFVAIGAGAFHDYVTNAVQSGKAGKAP